MRRLWEVLTSWLARRLIHPIMPDGTKVDGPSNNIYSLRNAIRSIMSNPVAITTNVAQTISAANFVQGVIRFTGTFSGGAAITLPLLVDLLAELGKQTPVDGGFGREILIVNDGTGQTLTVTASATITVSGTATVANNTARRFWLTISSSGAAVLQNVGTQNL